MTAALAILSQPIVGTNFPTLTFARRDERHVAWLARAYVYVHNRPRSY